MISRNQPTNAHEPHWMSTGRDEACGCHEQIVQDKVHLEEKKSNWGVQCPNTSLDSSLSLQDNGWNSKVVHHQEASAEMERQIMKREAERDMKEARPQSLAFSYTDKTEKDFTFQIIWHEDDVIKQWTNKDMNKKLVNNRTIVLRK